MKNIVEDIKTEIYEPNTTEKEEIIYSENDIGENITIENEFIKR